MPCSEHGEELNYGMRGERGKSTGSAIWQSGAATTNWLRCRRDN